MSAPLEADVVIIGSGVAGSLIAWRLAEAKLKVLILEAGPRIDRVEAFKSYLAASDKTPARHIHRPPTRQPHSTMPGMTTTSTLVPTSFAGCTRVVSVARPGIGPAQFCATDRMIFG